METIEFCGKFYFRGSPLLAKGDRIPQHSHDVSHPTLCGSGSAAFFVNDKPAGIVTAGHAVLIEAGANHHFIALEDGTRLFCIFDAEDALRLKEKGF